MGAWDLGIVGAGSWGTAVAKLLAEKGNRVLLWCREDEVARSVNELHENCLYLPGVRLPEDVVATCNIKELSSCRILVNGVPVQFIRDVWKDSGLCPDVVVNLAKGIEVRTRSRVSEIFASLGISGYAVLSGPSFAREVASGKPTAVTVASFDEGIAVEIRDLFYTSRFRVYSHTDVTGVEVAGALKNVVAIAAGICDGLGLGHSARASLINRGLVEMARFGVSVGADVKTFWGLAGMGDLVLTCTGDLSRNRRFGVMVGKGVSFEEALSSAGGVVEGVETVKAVCTMAKELGVDMPISFEVYSILFEGKDPLRSVEDLLLREPKFEFHNLQG